MSITKSAAEHNHYLERLNLDALNLTNLRSLLRKGSKGTMSPAILDDVRVIAQRLSRPAPLRGFEMVSISASALEEAVVESRAAPTGPDRVLAAIDSLLMLIDLEQSELRECPGYVDRAGHRHATTTKVPALTPP